MTEQNKSCTNEKHRADNQELKELFNSQITNIHTLIDANDKNYNQRFENVIQATSAALAAADRAVNKAEMASEKRFDAVNEFRSTLADQQRTLMPRNEVDILVKGLNEKIDSLTIQRIASQGQNSGLKEGWGYAIAAIGIAIAIMTIVLKFVK